MRTIVIGLLLSVSSMSMAEVLEVNIWKPELGKAQLTFQDGQDAKAIHETLGADVTVAGDLDGRMHYVQTFENWAAWAAFGNKVDSSEAWSAFLAKTRKNPSAELEDNYLLNVPSSGGSGSVYQVFIWEAELGRGNDLFEAGMQAKAIHEKAGASVGINYDQMQRMHYVMSFDSWEAWAKFQDTPSPEFDAFLAEQNKDPTAKLVKVYTASNL